MKKLVAATCAIAASMLVGSSALADTVTRTPSPVIFVGLCQFEVLAQAIGPEAFFPGATIGPGRTVIQISPTGVATVVSQVGNYTSLCGLLS